MVTTISADPEEAAAAELIRLQLKERGYTHESFAEKVGVSAGRVSQWATNRGGVPPERASIVARELGLDPDLVSVSWRRLRDEFMASQLSRLTPSIITKTVQRMRHATNALEGEPVNVESDPALFAEMLRLTILESMEEADGKRGVWQASGQGGRAARTTREEKVGNASGTAPSRRRKRA